MEKANLGFRPECLFESQTKYGVHVGAVREPPLPLLVVIGVKLASYINLTPDKAIFALQTPHGRQRAGFLKLRLACYLRHRHSIK